MLTNNNKERYLTEKEVSEQYKYSRSTLQDWRWRGIGPKFIKVRNRVLYPVNELESYFNQFPLQQSTSETGGRSNG